MKKKTGSWAAFCLGLILLAALVQLAGSVKGDRLVFPGVGEILKAFFALLRAPETYLKIWVTLRHLLITVAASAVLGVALGLLEGLSDFARELFRPAMILMRAIPMIVLVVIVMVLFPYRLVPVIGSTLILIPLISEAAMEGCRAIDRELIDVWRMNSRLSWTVIRHVYLPMMAGYLRQAYAGAVGMGIKLAVTTEYLVQTRDSLGKAVYSAAYFNEYQDIYAYALIMIVLALLLTGLPRLIGKLAKSRPAAEKEAGAA